MAVCAVMNEPIAVRAVLDRLLDGEDLSETEAGQLLSALIDADLAPAMAGAVLAALRAKGVTAAELRGFARRMRALARRPELPPLPDAVDIVGTGGDRSGSLNLSTGAALLAAACGLPVFKHGNRSISSRAGSADVLQALGVPLPLAEADAGRRLHAVRCRSRRRAARTARTGRLWSAALRAGRIGRGRCGPQCAAAA